jgi:hypothetical protein
MEKARTGRSRQRGNMLLMLFIANKMEKYLNTLHYCIYLFFYKLHLLVNKINPTFLLLKLPSIKKKYKKKGINPYKEFNKSYNDEANGINTIYSGGILGGSLSVLLFSLSIAVSRLFGLNEDFINKITYIIALVIIPYLLCYLMVFKKDKYLSYFTTYKNWSKKERRMYFFLTFAYFFGIIFLFFGVFLFR